MLITLVALFVLAGPVIRGFTLAMLFGGVVSSYTSMFVAAPLLYVIGVKREWGGDVCCATQGPHAHSRPESWSRSWDLRESPREPEYRHALARR